MILFDFGEWKLVNERKFTKNTLVSVFSVSFSPNGKWLASGGVDCNVKIWLVDDEKGSKDLIVNQTTNSIILSLSWKIFHNGEYLTTRGHDKTVRLWRPNLNGSIPSLTLFWASSQTVLCLVNANISNSIELSYHNSVLLIQRGATETPKKIENPQNPEGKEGNYMENEQSRKLEDVSSSSHEFDDVDSKQYLSESMSPCHQEKFMPQQPKPSESRPRCTM